MYISKSSHAWCIHFPPRKVFDQKENSNLPKVLLHKLIKSANCNVSKIVGEKTGSLICFLLFLVRCCISNQVSRIDSYARKAYFFFVVESKTFFDCFPSQIIQQSCQTKIDLNLLAFFYYYFKLTKNFSILCSALKMEDFNLVFQMICFEIKKRDLKSYY